MRPRLVEPKAFGRRRAALLLEGIPAGLQRAVDPLAAAYCEIGEGRTEPLSRACTLYKGWGSDPRRGSGRRGGRVRHAETGVRRDGRRARGALRPPAARLARRACRERIRSGYG